MNLTSNYVSLSPSLPLSPPPLSLSISLPPSLPLPLPLPLSVLYPAAHRMKRGVVNPTLQKSVEDVKLLFEVRAPDSLPAPRRRAARRASDGSLPVWQITSCTAACLDTRVNKTGLQT